jgi:hypothetical protein
VDIAFDGRDGLLINKISANEVFDQDFLKHCQGKRYLTPASEHLHEVLRKPLSEFLPNDNDYDTTFDRFEYLFAIAYLKNSIEENKRHWAPIGRFGYRRGNSNYDISAILLSEWEKLGPAWAPISSGIFPDPNEFQVLDRILKEEVLVHFRPY